MKKNTLTPNHHHHIEPVANDTRYLALLEHLNDMIWELDEQFRCHPPYLVRMHA